MVIGSMLFACQSDCGVKILQVPRYLDLSPCIESARSPPHVLVRSLSVSAELSHRTLSLSMGLAFLYTRLSSPQPLFQAMTGANDLYTRTPTFHETDAGYILPNE